MTSGIIGIDLSNGFGHQLCEVAFGMSVARRFNMKFKFERQLDNQYNDIWNRFIIMDNYCHDVECEYNIIITDEIMTYDEIYSLLEENVTKNILLRGYFQDVNEWDDINIMKTILSPEPLYIRNYIDYKYKELDITSAAVMHIKLRDSNRSNFCNDDYYIECLDHLVSNNQDVHTLLLVSDDYDQIVNKMPHLYERMSTFKGLNVALLHEPSDVATFYIIARCKSGVIIPGSTFSWWGALINESKNIYMPCKWHMPKTMLWLEGTNLRVSSGVIIKHSIPQQSQCEEECEEEEAITTATPTITTNNNHIHITANVTDNLSDSLLNVYEAVSSGANFSLNLMGKNSRISELLSEKLEHHTSIVPRPNLKMDAVKQFGNLISNPPPYILEKIDQIGKTANFDKCFFMYIDMHKYPSYGQFYADCLQDARTTMRARSKDDKCVQQFILIVKDSIDNMYPEVNLFFNKMTDCHAIAIHDARNDEILFMYIMSKCKFGGIVSGIDLTFWASQIIDHSNKLVYMRKETCDMIENGSSDIKIWKCHGEVFNEGTLEETDKNKLEGCPPILWINLERSLDRKKYMETILDGFNLKNKRIDAIDGLDKNFNYMVFSHPSGTPLENACTASHIKAINTFLKDYPDEEYVLIMEDDISFANAKYWKKTIKEYIDSVPSDAWDIIQMSAIICDENDYKLISKLTPVPRKEKWWSTAAYVINRSAAKTIVEKYTRFDGMMYDFTIIPDDGIHKPLICADYLIYNSFKTLIIPLFTYLARESLINKINDVTHCLTKNTLDDFWRN